MIGEDRGSSLAMEMAQAVYAVSLDDLDPGTIEQVKTLIIDALACIQAAPPALTGEARMIAGPDVANPCARLLSTGERVGAATAALVNGALLRSRDLMDVYAEGDVCHPSEAIPAILAAAEQVGASGRTVLEAVAAAASLHVLLSRTMPMHPHGLHHTGHAAFVTPLVIARVLGLGAKQAAAGLNLSARGVLVPEGFSRGHITNLKTYAYGMHAKAAFDALAMTRSGLKGADRMLEEMVSLWESISGAHLDSGKLTGRLDTSVIGAIWLKQYPAQYALQPLISEAIMLHRQFPDLHGRIDQIEIKVSRATVERCADRAKYAPTGAEAADHSLPFCFGAALVDGAFGVDSLERKRWEAGAVKSVMARIHAVASSDAAGYAVGEQEILIRLESGESLVRVPRYPASGSTWRDIAMHKLTEYGSAHLDVSRFMKALEGLESARSIYSLTDMFLGINTPRC